MLLKHAMTSEIHTASTAMCAAEAAQLMEIFRVSFLPVASHGMPVGLVSASDIVKKVVARSIDPADALVSQIMDTAPVTISEECEVSEAALAMRKHQTGRVLVTRSDGTLAGVFTLADLAMHWEVDEAGEVLRRISERKPYAFAS